MYNSKLEETQIEEMWLTSSMRGRIALAAGLASEYVWALSFYAKSRELGKDLEFYCQEYCDCIRDLMNSIRKKEANPDEIIQTIKAASKYDIVRRLTEDGNFRKDVEQHYKKIRKIQLFVLSELQKVEPELLNTDPLKVAEMMEGVLMKSPLYSYISKKGAQNVPLFISNLMKLFKRMGIEKDSFG